MAQVLAAVPIAGLEAVLVAVDLALEAGAVSAEHVLNVIGRLKPTPEIERIETSLVLTEAPRPILAATTRCVPSQPRRTAMRDVIAELKSLRLHGMAQAWADMTAQGTLASVESSRWLIEHLLQAENTDRGLRSIRYQLNAAKFPIHRDLASFDFAASVARCCSTCSPSCTSAPA